MRKHDLPNKLPVKESPKLADGSSWRLAPVSATVYLDANTLERIKQVCREENLRISDVLADAVDCYLRGRGLKNSDPKSSG